MITREEAVTETHSPGPWRAGRRGVVVCDSPVPGFKGSDEIEWYGGHLICESVTDNNVPLIAAAPDLLEACEAALPVMLQWADQVDDGISADDRDDDAQNPLVWTSMVQYSSTILAQLRAAIARAKGETE